MSFGLNTGLNFGSNGFNTGFSSDPEFQVAGGGTSARSNSGFGDWLSDYGKNVGKVAVQEGTEELFDRIGLESDPNQSGRSTGGSGGGSGSRMGGGSGSGFQGGSANGTQRTSNTQQTGMFGQMNQTLMLFLMGGMLYLLVENN